MSTRRAFVGAVSRCVAGVAVGRLLPLTRDTRRTAPDVWVPDPTSADVLRALATHAIDAARQAGASFADVRVGERRSFGMERWAPGLIAWRAGYGVRVLVNGAWGVAHGDVLTVDAVTATARAAVTTARGAAAVRSRGVGRFVELAAAAVVTGEWSSPVVVSPFAVSLDDHARVLGSWERAIARIYGAELVARARWDAGTRVVASSEGTLVTLHVTRAWPYAHVSFRMPRYSDVERRVSKLDPVTAGFEAVLAPEIPEQIVMAVEEARRLARFPTRSFDAAGRFPVVFDGEAMATMVGTTIGRAFDGDRVTGLEADAAGGSFLAPNREALLSPLVTLSADRAMPAYTATPWDDEGVATSPVVLVDKGHIRSWLTTRETARLLAPDGRSVGMAVADDPTQPVVGGGAHLTLGPATAPGGVDTLIRDMSHGIVCYGGTCLTEPNLSTGLLRDGRLFEVRRGEYVAVIGDSRSFQFQTRRWFGSQLRALGDPSTGTTVLVRSQKGMPWQDVTQVASAPAALVADADVVSL